VISGTEVNTSVRIRASSRNVLSWSLCIAQDGLAAIETTSTGTDFERLSQGGFEETGISPDGSAYFAVGALSFTEPVTLPAGASEVLRARCLVSRKSPGRSRITPVDGRRFPGDDREFRNEILLSGGELVPLELLQTSLNVLGCAAFVIELLGAEGETPGAVEVRGGSPVGVTISVHIESPAHLSPTGFSFGLAHAPDLFGLEQAALIPELIESFVQQDGFARLEISEGGFAAQVLSSATSPQALLAGDHAVARAAYRFQAKARAGEVISTQITLSDDLTLDGSPVKSVFQPLKALPCSRAALPLQLIVGPDHWIRGDVNSDGLTDIADAITMLGRLFLGGQVSCLRSMDANADGRIDIGDPIALLGRLFLGAPPLAQPYPACGAAEETFSCNVFPCPVT
jgi:hypothetical protein